LIPGSTAPCGLATVGARSAFGRSGRLAGGCVAGLGHRSQSHGSGFRHVDAVAGGHTMSAKFPIVFLVELAVEDEPLG